MANRLWHERAHVGHIEELIPQLRPGDRAEVIAADGDLERGCLNALHLSNPITAGAMRDSEGELIAVYGAAPISLLAGSQAAPWMLGTPRMRTNAMAVFHDMKRYVVFLSEHYTRLFNYVDVRNVESAGWLSRLGFVMGEPEPHGPLGLPFLPFHMDFD